MKKIEANDPAAQSADIVTDNISQLQGLFPEAFAEGKVQFDTLRQLLGGRVDETDEKYGLNWHGKRRARQIALTPSTGTLRPCPDESVDWATTQNLMIEGDNLEVLKLLQKSYAGKVKMIYIDPPYNTGRDFVYPDNFRGSIESYLELTGKVEGGKKLTTNTDTSGRFHTDWLNLMYPRLKLARSLLREDGVLLVSLDDGEIDNLRLVMKEVFGEENFVAQILWKKRSSPPNDKIIGANHDYIALFCRNIDAVKLNLKERSQDQLERYRNPDNHPKGVWAPGDLMANVKGGRYVESLNYPIVNPKTGQSHLPSETERGNWRFAKDKMDGLIAQNEIYFGEDGRGRPKLKRFLCDVKDGVSYSTIWDFVPLNTKGSSEMQELFGNSTVFESPKPVGLIQELIKLGTDTGDMVMDFFAGSGTTGHSAMIQNLSDSGTRRFILVQLPEPLAANNNEQKTAMDYCDKIGKPRNIAELTKERLRRTAAKIKAENPMYSGDTGFRVFKLDKSNIREWNPNQENLTQTLLDHHEHILEGRTEADIVYELLLKLGLDLCVPIESRTVAGKSVGAVGGGVLMLCLAEKISAKEVEAVAAGIVSWHKELAPAGDSTVVFRDSAFADDVAKTNMSAILAQNGLENVRSL